MKKIREKRLDDGNQEVQRINKVEVRAAMKRMKIGKERVMLLLARSAVVSIEV